jgi:hypothetical protein
MEKLKIPPFLQFGSLNLAEIYRQWEQLFRVYFATAELEKKSKPTQAAILLNVVGPEALEVYNTFALEPAEKKNDIDEVLKKFKAHCQSHRNTVYERHRFWTRDQQEEESIDQWVTDMKTKAIACEFGEQQDQLIRDKIVFGLAHGRVKERLLREPNLNLTKAIKICRAAEATRHQLQAMATSVEVHALDSGVGKRQHGAPAFQTETRKVSVAAQTSAPCQYCGEIYAPWRCPAYGKTCGYCHKRNHRAKVCQQKSRKRLAARPLTLCKMT